MQALLDQLVQLLDRSVHVPGSGKVLVDDAALRRLIDEMRLAVGDEARIDQRLAAERDKVLADARQQARHIIDEAQNQINARLEEQNTVQAARERARAIVADAEQQANRMRAEANTYVSNQLHVLEGRLQRLLHEVQAGQRYLTQSPAEKPTSADSSRQS